MVLTRISCPEDPDAGGPNSERTQASLDKLSFMIQFNQRGSMSSINRGSRPDVAQSRYVLKNLTFLADFHGNVTSVHLLW